MWSLVLLKPPACAPVCLVFAVVLRLVFLLAMAASSAEQDRWERTKANPMIGVADLQVAVEGFFEDTGHRSLDAFLSAVASSGIGWKTASKVLNFIRCC